MRNSLFTKGLVFGIMIFLFVGASVIPSIGMHINGNQVEIDKNSRISKINRGGIIFFDDFNDNIKDYDKWTEKWSQGTWWERNERTEFQLYEGDGQKYEGIQSSAFTVSLSPDVSVKLTCDMITDIAHYEDWQWVGNVAIRITDPEQSKWIEARYNRNKDKTIFRDSNDTGWTELETDKDDGTWSNSIEIFSDRYLVEMDNVNSGPVYDVLFSSNPTLSIELYIELGGSYPDFWWRAGFDNVYVYGNNPPLVPIINGPNEGIAGEEIPFTIETSDPEEDMVYYWIDWGDETSSSWLGPYNSGQTVDVSHIWDELGDYFIKAKAKDEDDMKSDWSEPFNIQINPDVELEIKEITGGLCKINAVIKNSGGAAAEDISWTISITDGLILWPPKRSWSEIIPILDPDDEEIISNDGCLFGFGNIEVTVEINSPDVGIIREIRPGYIFLFLVRVYY